MPVGPQPTRVDTWLITLNMGGRDMGVWDTFSGGEMDSEEAKYRPGGMSAEISLGGRQTVGNITIARYMDRQIDWPQIKWLAAQRGGGTRGVIGLTPLAPDGMRGGEPLTFTATLKTVTIPELDSMGSDQAMVELEFTVDGTPA